MNTPSQLVPNTPSSGRHRARRSRRLLTGVLVAVAASVGPGSARAEDWATAGLDALHGRYSLELSGADFSYGRWSAAASPGRARVVASPVVSDGLVIVVDLDGVVRALRANDGGAVWQATVASAVQGTPAVSQGRVYIPTFGKSVVALRLTDGARLWARDVGGAVLSAPTPVGADIVVSAGLPQRHIVRLSGVSGDVVWRSPDMMEQFSNTSPAIGDGVVVVGSNGGRYYAFDVLTGAPRWTYVADGIVHLASPSIMGGRVYLAGGGDSDRVHAVDAATGTPLPGWPIRLPTPEVDVAGTRVKRSRAVSSFSAAGRVLLLQTRLDDALDTNGDLSADTYLSREMVVGLDPTTGKVLWQNALARGERLDPNEVPKFFLCPTPAAFRTAGDAPLAVVASSLDATVTIIDVATGAVRARQAVAGAALASPVVANGRLIVAALDGTTEGLLSSVNRPPSPPTVSAEPRSLDVGEGKVSWSPALDPDGETPSYELRIDSDGEILQSWKQRIVVGAGLTSAPLMVSLTPGITYSYAVRARDPHGAYSSWSALGTFQVTQSPQVTVAGVPVKSLREAVATAQPQEEIVLGAGTYSLGETLHVGAGKSIRGQGPGRTKLDATGLAVGVSVEGEGAVATHLEGVTVTGANVCIRIAAGNPVTVSHVIAHDCVADAIVVDAGAAAAIANATLIGNGHAVRVAGAATIKNSLLAKNGVALAVEAPGTLGSTYNDLFANQTDYSGTAAGLSDLATPVVFADLDARDLRLLTTQASTDKGDPADPSDAEPTPNGGRINLGAFGGTADAEPSAPPSTAVAGGAARPNPTAGGSPAGPGAIARDKTGSGCAITKPRGGGDLATPLLPVLALLVMLARTRHTPRRKTTARRR